MHLHHLAILQAFELRRQYIRSGPFISDGVTCWVQERKTLVRDNAIPDSVAYFPSRFGSNSEMSAPEEPGPIGVYRLADNKLCHSVHYSTLKGLLLD